MKRVLATMLVVAVAGCGPQNPGKGSGTPSPTPQSSQPQATETAPYVIRPIGRTGSDWRVIGVSGKRPNRQVEMIDQKSIVTSGTTRRMWMARVSEGAGDLSYILIFDEYDCNQRTAKNINMAPTSRDGKLAVIQGTGRVENVIPGTSGSNYLQYACGTLNAEDVIPDGVDPIMYLKDEFRKISEQHLTETMEVIIRRDQNKLSLPESRAILIAFRGIAANENDTKLIDTITERTSLAIAIRSNAPNRAVWLDLFNDLRLRDRP